MSPIAFIRTTIQGKSTLESGVRRKCPERCPIGQFANLLCADVCGESRAHGAHRPPRHWRPAAHGALQPPQCAAFVRVSTHSPAHEVRLTAQLHVPPLHEAPAGHVTPQAPQLRTSEVVFAHTPPHDTVGATQFTLHFVLEGTHTPLQSDCPDGHEHVPVEHCSPPGQGRSHAPQFRLLESVSTQAWSHAVSPGVHDAAHRPWLQKGVEPLQITPQPPQFDASVVTSTHAPAHASVPFAQEQWPPVHD